jgi:hypothetical protein
MSNLSSQHSVSNIISAHSLSSKSVLLAPPLGSEWGGESESGSRNWDVSILHVHECDRRQEPPVKLLENLLVEQCHVDFAFSNEQRVSIENLVGQRAARRLFDMLNGVDSLLDGRALLLLCGEALTIVSHSVVEIGVR